ncbi:DUF5954 family protein [Streptomyces sp. NPDC052114]|uniref:DUF5954 family protein n=1 Tax=unclassified Streptomyces TaxID=2593676 RepID=UPI00341A19F5
MTDDWKRHLARLHAGLVDRDDPAELVAESDAVDASVRYPHLALRGPVFGLAVRDPAADAAWRVLKPVVDGTPQQVRDALNSHLWFRAKDETDDPGERRQLLAAVAVLEREPVDELEVRGTRYRVVRGDEFARIGEDGLEPPRPTDREAADRSWTMPRRATRSCDADCVLGPDASPASPMTGALLAALRGFAYSGARFPDDVCTDSRRAVATHPDVVLLPVGFGVAERDEEGWQPLSTLRPTPHEARRTLYSAMTETWPLLYEFDAARKAAYARAADRFKAAGRANEVRVGKRLFRICRIQRLVRLGPDGPEPPRPSDQDTYGPTKMHPTMDEDGTIHQ